MRPGRLACVILIMISGTAAAGSSPEVSSRARRLMETAVAHERAGQNQKAIEELSQAIATRALKRPDAARAMFDRGVAYDALGNTRAAIADYSSALRLEPTLSPALNNRANAYRRLGQFAQAKRDYLAALKKPDGSREYPYYGLGLIAEKLGDTETARDFFQKALAMNPAFALAAQSLAGLAKPDVQTHPVPGGAHFAQSSPQSQSSPPPATVTAKRPRVAEPVLRTDPVLRQAVEEGNVSAIIVQLGAYKDQKTALVGWDKIAAAADGALRNLVPITVAVDLPGKGRLWRLRTAVSDKEAARKLCASLSERHQACMLAKD